MSLVQEIKRELEKYLFSHVAHHLTGRMVEIRHTSPPIDGARGLCLKANSGDHAIVWLHPDLQTDDRLQVFLHECAHAKLHFAGLARESDISRVAEVRDSAGEYVPEWLLTKRYDAHLAREVEAREQAAAWGELVQSESGLSRKLIKLLDW